MALLVLLSHVGLSVASLNPGVVAVVVFYAISGYVMSGLIQSYYGDPGQTGRFYIDRFFRLYPQYAIYALFTALWWLLSGRDTAFLQHSPSGADFVRNLTVIPLNLFMFNSADKFTLIPPAWSLGAEVMFYAVAPFMWRHVRLAVALAVVSLGVQSMAWLGVLNSDWWGYRLLPGVFWIFVGGMALHRMRAYDSGAAWRLAVTISFLACLVAFLLWRTGLLAAPYHREVLLGAGLGFPLLVLLTQPRPSDMVRRWHGFEKIDELLGNLSYGIFLNHFLIIWILELDLLTPSVLSSDQMVWLVMASVLASTVTYYFVEYPAKLFRRRWRRTG